MQQDGPPAPGVVHDAFEQVLSGADFRYIGTSPLVHAWQAITGWIQRFIDRWFPGLDEGQARVVSWIVLALCALFAVYLATRWFRDRVSPASRRDAAGPERPLAPRNADEWMEWARNAAQAGRLREAATGVYQGTILALDARGTLRYREWKTPGDYAREVTSREGVRVPFLDFLGRFLEVAFGPVEPTEEAFEALSAGSARLRGPA